MTNGIATFGWLRGSNLGSISIFGWFTATVSVGGTVAFAGAGFTLSGDFGIGTSS